MLDTTRIDKRLVQVLVSQITARFEEYANSMPKEQMPDLALVGERFMFAILGGVHAIADDRESEAEMVNDLVFGMMHAALQAAFAFPSQRIDPTQRTQTVN